MKRSIWIGFEPRELDAFNVCLASIRAHLSEDIPIFAVALDVMVKSGMYQRPMRLMDGRIFDIVSDAYQSTEFAISRFFIPFLCDGGSALFMDCDILVRTDLAELFALADPRYAVQVVKHEQPPGDGVKMDGQIQSHYERKNWSSVALWNLDNPANRQLTLNKLNNWSGRALHQFQWLEDSEIGALHPEWNHLVGVDVPDIGAKIAHFTLGIPRMAGYENSEFAPEWRECLASLP